MKPANQLIDYEENEFLSVVHAIWNVELPQPEHDLHIAHFNSIVAHPEGSDLLFCPQSSHFGVSNSPTTVIDTLKAWHQSQGRPAFKDHVLAPTIAPAAKTREQRASESSSLNLERARTLVAQVQAAEQQAAGHFAALEQQLAAEPAHGSDALAALRSLESAQYQAKRSVDALKRQALPVRLAYEGAQRDTSSRFLDSGIQALVLQAMTQGSQQHAVALASALERHPPLYQRGVERIERLEAQTATLAPGPLALKGAAQTAGLYPALLTAQGMSRDFAQQQYHLIKTFRSALAELHWQATSPQAEPGTQVQVLEFVFASPSEDPRFAVTVPLAELFEDDLLDWAELAQRGAKAMLPFRLFAAVQVTDGEPQSIGVKPFTHRSEVLMAQGHGAGVPVRAARWDEQLQAYVVGGELPGAPTLLWCAGEDAYAPVTTDRPASIGYLRLPPVPQARESAPAPSFNDCIVVFAPEADLSPVYVMFGNRRMQP